MKKILITGGAGYIGSHTAVELVKAGLQPVIIDDLSNSNRQVLQRLKELTGQDIPFFEGDCGDQALLNQIFGLHRISGIIHFAAYKAVGESTENPLKYYQNNVGSLMTILSFMKEKGIKDLVFSSSCTVYGQPDVLPVTESTPRKDAESPYGNTKKICEDILVDMVKSEAGLRVISLRYFNPVGAHSSAKIGELPLGTPNNLVPFVTQTAAGIREKLTVFGGDYDTPDGTCIRDYIHVVDLADAHLRAIEYLGEQEMNFYDVFNVGTGNGNSVLEVIQVWADTQKINKVLGWYPKLSLDESMRDSWNWQLAIGDK